MPKSPQWSRSVLEKVRSLPERQKIVVVSFASVGIVLLVVFVLTLFSRIVL